MNKLKKIFTIILLFLFIFLLFRYNFILNKSVVDSTTLWLTKVFPSLFIMFILNDIIINTNLLEPLNKIINPFFNKLFKTSGNSSEAFILSLFSGTPSSAFIIKEMLNNNTITLNDANKLISFTYFSNPLFLYNILSLSFNKYITFKIIIIHYLTNIIIGLLMRNKYPENNYLTPSLDNTSANILLILPSAITKSLNTLFMILGTITFYMIITNLLTTLINFSSLFQIIIKGLFEITQALNILPSYSSISIIKEIIALALISFGGLSIHTQVLSIINDTKISYKKFFIGRLLHVLFSTTTYLFVFYCGIG